MKIVSVGEATVDYYPHIGRMLVGGISLNYAVQAKRCGAETVALVSCVGSDEHGQAILERLEQEQIDTSHMAILEGKTAYCEIVVRENGERYFPPNSYHQHVLSTYALSDSNFAFIQQHDFLAARFDISYPKTMFNQVMRDLAFEGKRIADFGDWFDYKGRHPEILPYFEHVDLAFISGDEATIAAFLPHSSHPRTQLVVTLGEQGSVALRDGEVIAQEAIPVPKIVDTTGCGDAFQAAFTVEYFRSHNMRTALRAGAENATQVLQHVGAS